MIDERNIGTLLKIFIYFFKGCKFLLKATYFCGLLWFCIPIGFILICESVFGVAVTKGSLWINLIFDITCAFCFILMPYTLLQNILRMVKKDRTFNLLGSILSRSQKKGFEAKLGEETVALKPAGSVSGVIFGKQKGKYVTMPETTDGHILV